MANQPLADKLRPQNFDDIVGQQHLVGENGIIRKLVERGRIPNMIFYGPPGIGKTTVANIIAKSSDMQLYTLNATTASLSDIKEVIASSENIFSSNGTLLYLDEIQYFNRKQQQSLLEFLENGKITLIASTTENPYYCIYKALLSRSSVFEFKAVTGRDCIKTLKRALTLLNNEFGTDKSCDEELLLSIANSCAGDVRMSIGVLENAFYLADSQITEETVTALKPDVVGCFDRDGDVHYDLLSCLQKSIRGSDPDAAVFYLAKLLAAGEFLSVCRRLQVIASEDVGLAYPQAAAITRACCESARELGMPEARIPLANAALLLATSPKSNSAEAAVDAAGACVERGMGIELPVHLQSPLFKGYKYPHDFENHYVAQEYLPRDLTGKTFYTPGTNKTEQAAAEYWKRVKGQK